ncbi:hypothetical protein [Aestuariibaculum sediminum]|uniref:Uncharacterized protein n=1 Tax=Aestuariibaculum sediminum TaxID=2770637 RepID=A0A8J6Q6C7_9FLAO|nr:hypothetical protein [Aestuariibaculum sediminum]MBD0830615.1 hypothetical protein [Aestuariibaculum sediminum]
MEEQTTMESQFEEFETLTKKRRNLLPWWIKFFSWFFMIFGVFTLICLCIGIFGGSAELSFYGFETYQPISALGLLIVSLALYKAFVGYSLWFEKDNAVMLGKMDAILGIILCTVGMVIIPFFQEGFNLNIRAEIAFLIPFLIRLRKIESRWKSIV